MTGDNPSHKMKRDNSAAPAEGGTAVREIIVRVFAPHPMVVSSCTELLANALGIRLASGAERFDVGVMDGDSFDRLPALLADKPYRNAKILVLLASADISDCLKWMMRGARGVIAYKDCADHLAQAVKDVAEGRLWMPAEVALRGVAREYPPHIEKWLARFTGREAEIGRLIAARMSYKEIAAALCLSLSTVKTHVHAAYTKAGVHSRAEFVSFWLNSVTK